VRRNHPMMILLCILYVMMTQCFCWNISDGTMRFVRISLMMIQYFLFEYLWWWYNVSCLNISDDDTVFLVEISAVMIDCFLWNISDDDKMLFTGVWVSSSQVSERYSFHDMQCLLRKLDGDFINWTKLARNRVLWADYDVTELKFRVYNKVRRLLTFFFCSAERYR
jgi:hypothetical protein